MGVYSKQEFIFFGKKATKFWLTAILFAQGEILLLSLKVSVMFEVLVFDTDNFAKLKKWVFEMNNSDTDTFAKSKSIKIVTI